MSVKTKEDIRDRIHRRIRKKRAGTPARPRLAVFRSQAHIYAQLIDDEAGRTLCAASSVDAGLRKPDPYKQKGIRYTGEVLKKKAGKAGATGAK